MTDDRRTLSVELVCELIADQFPQWADLPITPILPGGWNNRSFRLGETMVLRLPSAERYVAQVQKEQHFLPYLTSHLPLPIPQAIALGKAGADYPWPFGVYGWIEGDTAAHGGIDDPVRFAQDLAHFLNALHNVETADGPAAGLHNFYRGDFINVYNDETRAAIANLNGKIDGNAATAIWDKALESQWNSPAVWLHGDIAPGNLLVQNGKLSAVIDFGSMGIGDPACDLAIAWMFLEGKSRQAFRSNLPLDQETWQRGRGWALWKTLITLDKLYRDGTEETGRQQEILQIILEHDLSEPHGRY
ncbi:aminoglycoside phosphotransferase family protein [Rhizobium sp.]|jgi:aminoglycoside phosphotransferase (APT) family kinase protein|uniref:aminoglycoside phosphotransferase family protein n=1 Tax=Rhizobium sp. TaxID=391 RepID=UPI000E845965|nr:aminoglycoside phosphotransferase [Rhizobium sp.]